MTAPLGEDIDEAIKALQSLIIKRVRSEQLRDQLTNLPNGAALDENLRELLDRDETWWVAFIEVDRFKAINDEFGYGNADAMLKAIAIVLNTARVTFLHGARAYRAHGDEFFLVGPRFSEGDRSKVVADVAGGLDLVCRQVQATRIPTDRGLMATSVSVGWVLHGDATTSTDPRSLHSLLELAVGAAKRTRGAVVRYTTEMNREPTCNRRSDCGACKCKFSFDIPRSAEQSGPVRCPNCGSELLRPPMPGAAPARESVTV
jgi:diguanylate cyclase (GGDEF)-like protein